MLSYALPTSVPVLEIYFVRLIFPEPMNGKNYWRAATEILVGFGKV